MNGFFQGGAGLLGGAAEALQLIMKLKEEQARRQQDQGQFDTQQGRLRAQDVADQDYRTKSLGFQQQQLREQVKQRQFTNRQSEMEGLQKNLGESGIAMPDPSALMALKYSQGIGAIPENAYVGALNALQQGAQSERGRMKPSDQYRAIPGFEQYGGATATQKNFSPYSAESANIRGGYMQQDRWADALARAARAIADAQKLGEGEDPAKYSPEALTDNTRLQLLRGNRGKVKAREEAQKQLIVLKSGFPQEAAGHTLEMLLGQVNPSLPAVTTTAPAPRPQAPQAAAPNPYLRPAPAPAGQGNPYLTPPANPYLP